MLDIEADLASARHKRAIASATRKAQKQERRALEKQGIIAVVFSQEIYSQKLPALPKTVVTLKTKAYTFALKRTGGHCWYCGGILDPVPGSRETATYDHVIPVSRGGVQAQTNLVPACSWCNSCKGSLSLDEWREIGPSDSEGLFWGEKR